MIWLRKLQSKYEYIITIYIYTKIEQIKKHSKSLYTVPCCIYFGMSIWIGLSLLIVIIFLSFCPTINWRYVVWAH